MRRSLARSQSPYSFLAKDPAYALEREFGVTLRLRPYALDILGAYNVADPKVAERGLRRIKYLYADVRRFANQRGMIIRGPQKIFDSTLIHLAWMFAEGGGKGRALIDAAYPRFFKRELDYEDRAAVEALLKEIGVDLAGFDAFATGAGPALLSEHQAEAQEAGCVRGADLRRRRRTVLGPGQDRLRARQARRRAARLSLNY